MPRVKNANDAVMFQSIKQAAQITGLSQKFIRHGCVSGEIPHIRIGSDYRVNMPLFVDMLNEWSVSAKEEIHDA